MLHSHFSWYNHPCPTIQTEGTCLTPLESSKKLGGSKRSTVRVSGTGKPHSVHVHMLVSRGCWNHTGVAYSDRHLCSHSAADQKSECKVSGGPSSLQSLQWRILPASSRFWWPQVFLGCGCVTPSSASIRTWPFSSAPCVSVCFCLSLTPTLVIGSGSHQHIPG